MNETKKISIEEAREKIEAKMSGVGPADQYIDVGAGAVLETYQTCIDILNNIEVPSEDEMAVLWLITEGGLIIRVRSRDDKTWEALAGDWEYKEINPAAEAKKRGWKHEQAD